jgi:hypothetical protein
MMLKYEFNNRHLNFYAVPESEYILGVKLDSIRAYIDLISRQADYFLNKYQNYEIKMFQPFNLLLGFLGDDIYIAFSTNKAISNLTIINFIKSELTNPPEDHLTRTIRYVYGGNIDIILKVNRELLLSHESVFEEYLSSLKDNSVWKVYIPNELKENLIEQVNLYEQSIIKEHERVIINPIFKARDITVDKSLCFAILPFVQEQLEIFDQFITPVLGNEFKMQVLKAKDIFSNNEIMEDIWTYICKSRFLIADISGKNPNVFYELGICHTLGKEVITICSKESYEKDYNNRFPFDIAHRRIITYTNSWIGMEQFKKDLIGTIQALLGKDEIL